MPKPSRKERQQLAKLKREISKNELRIDRTSQLISAREVKERMRLNAREHISTRADIPAARERIGIKPDITVADDIWVYRPVISVEGSGSKAWRAVPSGQTVTMAREYSPGEIDVERIVRLLARSISVQADGLNASILGVRLVRDYRTKGRVRIDLATPEMVETISEFQKDLASRFSNDGIRFAGLSALKPHVNLKHVPQDDTKKFEKDLQPIVGGFFCLGQVHAEIR